MRITIYQIIPELDRNKLLFMPLSYFQKSGYPSPPSEIYESVFCSEIKADTLEEIYRIFNRTNETDSHYLEKIGFTGHSLSVSDILEVQISPKESRFYFCDTFGFSQISFQKRNTMLPIQNHDFIPYKNISRSIHGYLAYIGNSEFCIYHCSQFQFQRCKYSQCQIGYRIRYKEKENWQQKEFLDRPTVLLFDDTKGAPPENLWYDCPNDSMWLSKFPIHSLENLKLLENWCQKSNVRYEYL